MVNYRRVASYLRAIFLMVYNPCFRLLKRLAPHPGLCLLASFFVFVVYLQFLGRINLAGIHRRFFGIELPKVDCPRRPVYNLTIMTVFKDTAPYLKEWLEFHFMLGVQRVYLYDNNSTDKPLKILRPYIDAGTVVYRYWPNHFHKDFNGNLENYSQKSAIMDAMTRFRCDSRWMALIDTDEFLLPGKDHLGRSLTDLLWHYDDFGSVAVAWLRFGTSGHKRPPAKLVVEAYTHRQTQADSNFKHIVQPRRLRGFMNIHEMFFWDGFISVDETRRPVTTFTNKFVEKSFNTLRLHHYFTRSCVDWWIRVYQRGAVSGGLTKYGFSDLHRLDTNDMLDATATLLADRVKLRMRWNAQKWVDRYFPRNRTLPPECLALSLS